MTARNRVVREPYATWCGRTPVEIIHGLLPDCLSVLNCSTTSARVVRVREQKSPEGEPSGKG